MALVRKGFPVLVFAQHDETHAGIEQLARDLRNAGADLMLAGAEAEGAVVLPTLRANATIEPLLMIQSFYRSECPRYYARAQSGSPAALEQSDGDGLMTVALVNGRILAEDGMIEGQAVLLDGPRIAALLPEKDKRVTAARRVDLARHLLLPGFLDTQVNGGGGVLFNAEPGIDTIREIGRAHRQFGTTGFLRRSSATISTSSRAPSLPCGRRSRRGCRACSASTSKGRSSTSYARAFTIRRSLRELDEGAIGLLTSLKAGGHW